MGGSGGGYSNWTPKQFEDRVRDAEKVSFEAGFAPELSNFLGDLLRQFNSRDVDTVNDRLNELKEFLSEELESSITLQFGGSVAKHTYVDGLSDVDALFVTKSADTDFENPNDLVASFADLIATKLGDSAKVKSGEMAVSVTYKDGTELQILPAAATADGNLKVSSPNGDNWSKIRPKAFNKILSQVNKECNYNLVPTIKLAKAINSTLPKSQQLTGYHLESLAVDAFKNYSGTKTKHEMLVNFFASAKTQVLKPITDKSGQSRHLDDYLGTSDSNERKRASYLLGRIEKRMRNANAAGSKNAWESIFGLDE